MIHPIIQIGTITVIAVIAIVVVIVSLPKKDGDEQDLKY